jgi:hypothetical protein
VDRREVVERVLLVARRVQQFAQGGPGLTDSGVEFGT